MIDGVGGGAVSTAVANAARPPRNGRFVTVAVQTTGGGGNVRESTAERDLHLCHTRSTLSQFTLSHYRVIAEYRRISNCHYKMFKFKRQTLSPVGVYEFF